MNIVNVNSLHAAVIIKTLAECGVKRAVISPGSRSTPLALAACDMPGWTTHVLIDERSAAFFALGLSKADGVPAALICTSGTAAANYYPAIIEAAQSGVPLIVLAADRPATLRGTGAPQTIDQVELYGKYTRFFADLPAAELSLAHARRIRDLAVAAIARAVSPSGGPVHLNVPLDEPLAPVEDRAREAERIWKQFLQELFVPAARIHGERFHGQLDDVAARLNSALCGLVVAGPDAARTDEEAQAIFLLGRRLGWPIFADVLSGLRYFGQPVYPYYDLFLRSESPASIAPDVVLAFGAHPVSKTLNAYLDQHRDAHTIRIQPDDRGRDPNRRASETIVGGTVVVCSELSAKVPASRDSLLYEPFRAASQRIHAAIEEHLDVSCEAQAVRAAVRALPDDSNLILANSLSVRYADAFCAAEGARIRVFGKRGASGIDGTLSHATGIAAASGKPSLLICGDLAFQHDLGGLAVARRCPNLRILLLNNDGGGIFHFLSAREHEAPDVFERIHGTPQRLQLSATADLFGIDWMTIQSPSEIPAALAESGSMRVIEYRSTREHNFRDYSLFIDHLVRAAER